MAQQAIWPPTALREPRKVLDVADVYQPLNLATLGRKLLSFLGAWRLWWGVAR
jgi:hypothetical protein